MIQQFQILWPSSRSHGPLVFVRGKDDAGAVELMPHLADVVEYGCMVVRDAHSLVVIDAASAIRHDEREGNYRLVGRRLGSGVCGGRVRW